MNQKSLLLPYWCQKMGWYGLLLEVVIIALCMYVPQIEEAMNNMELLENPVAYIIFILPPLSMMLICLSKEKEEDEYIQHVRANSVFIVVVLAFVVGMVLMPVKIVGARLWGPDVMGQLYMYTGELWCAMFLTLLYLVIFKCSLLINWLKTHNDGQ